MAGAPDFAAITSRQQATWGAGDFNIFAMKTMPVAEALVEAADPKPGHRVLDIACGSGNNALVAARRHCDVVGLDFVPALVARAKQRAAADGVPVEFHEGDAQAMPYPDKNFDCVLSTFGVMFAPNQEKAAAEILRVTKPGAKIAIASWMPEGFGGNFFRMMARYAPPPPGVKPGSRWGTVAGMTELLGSGAPLISARTRHFKQFFRSVDSGVEIFTTHFPIAVKVIGPADAATKAAFKKDLTELFQSQNSAKDGTLVMECEYFEGIARRA